MLTLLQDVLDDDLSRFRSSRGNCGLAMCKTFPLNCITGPLASGKRWF